MVYIFLAEGFEELEALSPIDILRRGGVEIKTVGVTGKTVTGSHGVPFVCDLEIKDASFENLEGIILPGGMPGTLNLENSADVLKFVDYAYINNLYIAAICAAPLILGHKNILNGKKATCYTGFEKDLLGATVLSQKVVKDGNIITAYGAGAAAEFALTLLEAFKNTAVANEIKTQMRY